MRGLAQLRLSISVAVDTYRHHDDVAQDLMRSPEARRPTGCTASLQGPPLVGVAAT